MVGSSVSAWLQGGFAGSHRMVTAAPCSDSGGGGGGGRGGGRQSGASGSTADRPSCELMRGSDP